MSDENVMLRPGNRLLNRLSAATYEELNPHIEIVQLSLREAVFKRERAYRYVYFPVSCVLSVVTALRSGQSVEVSTVGNEGFTCCDALIGGETASDNCICQVPGQSARMRIATFSEATNGDTELRRVAQDYMRNYTSQLSQTVACNRLHSTEERFAKWTLMMRDRAGSEHFHLNDEFLGYMLGEPRSTVRLVTRTFEHAGLLQYREGYVTLLQPAEIEAIACECYQTMKKAFRQMAPT
jgi:CRP-like cAMP-binding protein